MVTFYACSNGRYYSDVQVWERLEVDTWQACCWDPETGEEWVTSRSGALVHLRPVAEDRLPRNVTTESVAAGRIVVDESDP